MPTPKKRGSEELRALGDKIEERLKAGESVSQDDWDNLVEMFDDSDVEPPMPLDELEAEAGPVIDGRLRTLIREALDDLAKERK
jgi:hypothetical protein